MSEVKDIPKHWQIMKLGDLCDKMSNGANVKQSDEKIGYPISRIETIWNETINLDRVKYIVENNSEFKEKYALKKGDILFSHINSDLHLGKTAIYKNQTEVLIHGINLLLIRLKKEVSTDFLNYQFKLKRSRGEFIRIAQKSVNQSSINQFKLKNLEFIIPPFPEQVAIVAKIEELLSDLENGKQQLQTAQQQLKVYRQSLLKWALEGKLTNKNVKDGELPKGWKKISLKDVCEKVESVKRKEKNPEGELLYLDIGGIDNNTNKILHHKIYKWKNAPSRAQQIVFVDDILFSTVRTYMKNIAVVENKIFDGQIASSGFCVIRGNRKIVNPKYIFYYSTSQIFLQPLNELQTGSSYPAVRDKDVFSQQVPLPPIEEQQLIVQELESKLTVCDKIEETISQSLQQAETLRQSILKKAFEGKLVKSELKIGKKKKVTV